MEVGGGSVAPWSVRAGAFALDVVPGLGVVLTLVLLTLTASGDGWVRWVFASAGAATLLLLALNRLLLPALTGWTLGRAVSGIAVRRSESKGGGTEVCRVSTSESNIRPTLGWLLIAAAVVCAVAVGLGYMQVYRQERAAQQARVQIAERGPEIVEQILSYDVSRLPEDFERAQSLATDDYRSQLTAEQQEVQNSVRRGETTTSAYWTASGAVLTDPPVTPVRASMLLAMQGQRGTNPDNLKFVTATARVSFEKSPDGQWRVADLTLLKKPLMPAAGQ